MITADQFEQLAIQDMGWNYVHGAVIAPEAEPSLQLEASRLHSSTPVAARRASYVWKSL